MIAGHTAGPWAVHTHMVGGDYHWIVEANQPDAPLAKVEAFAPFDDDMEAAGIANAHLISAAPEMERALRELVSLFEAIRDDSVSTHFRFGATEADRKNRIQQLLGFIEANAARVDEALDLGMLALAKATGAA